MERAKHTCVFRTKATGTSREATWVTIARISSTWLHNSFSINFCLLCIQKYFSIEKSPTWSCFLQFKNPCLGRPFRFALKAPTGNNSFSLESQSCARGRLGPRSPEADTETRLCEEVTFAVSPPEELMEELKGAAEEGWSPSWTIAHTWWEEVQRETISPKSLFCIKTRTLTQAFTLLHQEVLA